MMSAANFKPLSDPRGLATVALQDHDRVTVASITGEVDISNVDAVARTLTQLPNAALGLVVDLSQATYMDSSSISLLHDLATRLSQRSQRLVIVCGGTALPHRVLTLTGVDSRVPVLDDVQSAVSRVRELADELPAG